MNGALSARTRGFVGWRWLFAVVVLLGAARPAEGDPPPGSLAEVLEEGRAAHRELMSMLGRARAERDIVRVSCYDEKLSGIHAALRNLEASGSSLRPRALRAARQRIHTLVRGAHECVCVYPAWWSGPSVVIVEVEIDPGIPQEDPTELPAAR